MAKSTAIGDLAEPLPDFNKWNLLGFSLVVVCLCMLNLHNVSNPQRIWLCTANDLERVHYETVPSALQNRPAHNLGNWSVYAFESMCVCNLERLGWNKRLHKVGGFSAQSLTSHPSSHRREITCSRALDTAVVPEDNALNQLFTPIEGINYQLAGKQNRVLYS